MTIALVLALAILHRRRRDMRRKKALERRYAIGSSVYLKRSNREETVAYVKEYNVEKALYTVELERLGSGKTKTCRDKDLRAVDTAEGLEAARAAAEEEAQAEVARVLAEVVAQVEEAEAAAQAEAARAAAAAAAQAEAARAAAEEAAQAEAARAAAEEVAQADEAARAAAEAAAQAEAARAAAEEAAQAEAARVQGLERTVPPTAVGTIDELRNRRSIFSFPRYSVPPTAFARGGTGNVRDVTRGQDSARQWI